MTLADERPPSAAGGSGGFDRTPPQAIEAEQSVLGAMMMSKDAIADVVEVLRPGDFYRPAHQLIYDAILDLYARGEPADPITTAEELTRAGQLARVGGALVLHTLVNSVPTAANAAYYAQIVAERATLRRLVTAGTRIVQMGYDSASGSSDVVGSVDDVVDRAQAEIYEVTERRTSEDYVHIETLLQPTLDEIENISANGGVGTGIPTGFAQLDEYTNGLHPGQMVTVAGRPGSGKALALDTPLPTPTGWTTMGTVQVGDLLLGADGRPTRVVAATDVLLDRPCFEVEFSDGSVITADAEHQWRTTTRASRRQSASARHGRSRMPLAAQLRAKAAAAAASDCPDELATVRDIAAVLGSDFTTTIQREAARLGVAGRVPRVVNGSERSYVWRAPAYPRRALTAAIAAATCEPSRPRLAAAQSPVLTTAQIAATLRCDTADRRLNHAVECTSPLVLPDAELPVPPYTLGAWLGDGTSASAQLTCADEQIVDRIRAEGIVATAKSTPLRYRLQLPSPRIPIRACVVCGKSFRPALSEVRTCGQSCGGKARSISSPATPATCRDCGRHVFGWRRCTACHAVNGTLQARLRTLGVLGNKHIPQRYLRASEAQRRALLAGLLDTDGYATATGSVEFGVTNRRLAEDVRELVVSLGYRASLRTKSVCGRSPESSVCYTVAFTPDQRVFGLERKAERQVTGVRAGTKSRYIVDVRPVASVPVRCVQVDNDDHMYLCGRTMIPTHNSTLALDFARSAAVKNGKPTVIFSLEMGKLEIMMRMFSAEAGVALQNMRSGHMSDQDWTRLARRSSELAEAPLFIDDSPNLTMMEIRAKARRLRQRHDLQLIVIDYLQLMTSGKRVESRQQEVSEFSRAMKLLAKELDVPVVTLSQLNRGPEQRTDKKPMLSDLRESGCLPASTRIWRADTGAEVTIGELYERGERDITVWAMDERLRMVPRRMTHVFSNGVKKVYRLRLASGRTVEATANHPFYTYDGWRQLGDLAVGERVAIPRSAPAPRDAKPWPEHEIVLLAHLIGDGSTLRRQPLRYASVDEANLSAVTAAAAQFGVAAIRDEYPAARVTTLRLPSPFRVTHGRRNPIVTWLDDLGVYDLRSHEKFVPAGVFGLPTEQVALFLRHLWSTDGCVHLGKGRQVRLYYATTSRRLADDVTRLLTRFGITARIKTTHKTGYRDSYQVHVVGSEQQAIFLGEIGVHGARGEIAERARAFIDAVVPNTNVDTVPRDVWDRVRTVLHEQKTTHREFAAAMSTHFCGSTMWKHAPSRARLARVAAILDDANLDMLATNDVFWDNVVSIEELGEQEVFDATVPGDHNFVADGVVVHNSIEQDSDMVILVHRPDLYEPETERAGEADLILAKHRNGPTATVAVAFQGRYSRFADMPS
jgi:replicative DNA helicase